MVPQEILVVRARLLDLGTVTAGILGSFGKGLGALLIVLITLGGLRAIRFTTVDVNATRLARALRDCTDLVLGAGRLWDDRLAAVDGGAVLVGLAALDVIGKLLVELPVQAIGRIHLVSC